jgi:hypothetical protein
MSLACTPTDRRCAISSRTLQTPAASVAVHTLEGAAARLGLDGIAWDNMGVNGQRPPGCGLRTSSGVRGQIATVPIAQTPMAWHLRGRCQWEGKKERGVLPTDRSFVWRPGFPALTPHRRAGSCLTDPDHHSSGARGRTGHLARLPPADRSQRVCDQLLCGPEWREYCTTADGRGFP